MIETWEKIIDPNFINAELIGPVGAERIVTIKDIDFENHLINIDHQLQSNSDMSLIWSDTAATS